MALAYNKVLSYCTLSMKLSIKLRIDSIAVYNGWTHRFARACNHDHKYYYRLSF